MSVCESVSIIAAEIESQLEELSEPESKRLNTLRDMHKYSKQARLDLFDSKFRQGYSENENAESTSYRAIEILSELAYENMYVKFSVRDTIRAYERAIDELNKIGIRISPDLDMSEP